MWKMKALFVIAFAHLALIYLFSRVIDVMIMEGKKEQWLWWTTTPGPFIINPLCPNLTAMPLVMKQAQWSTALPDKTYVYSAFLDNRTLPAVGVVVVGMCVQKCPTLWCQLWYDDHMEITQAKTDVVPDTQGKIFEPTLHTCLLNTSSPSSLAVPVAVSLVPSQCARSISTLYVHTASFQALPSSNVNKEWSPLPQHQFRYNYTVCFAPFHSGTNDAHMFISTMEANRMFGADHFVFYDLEVGTDMARVMQYYVNQGIAHILPWKVPLKRLDYPNPMIHYYGQLVAHNDCLYRRMLDSRYVVFTDMDEIIVPQKDNSWDALLARVSESKFPVGAWEFMNTFFPLEWEDDPNSHPLAKQYNITPLLKTTREKGIYERSMRSKFIVRPQLESMMGVHYIYQHFDKRVDTVVVDPEDALLQHYRNEVFDGQVDKTPVRHARMLNYTEELVQRVVTVMKELFHQPGK